MKMHETLKLSEVCDGNCDKCPCYIDGGCAAYD